MTSILELRCVRTLVTAQCAVRLASSPAPTCLTGTCSAKTGTSSCGPILYRLRLQVSCDAAGAQAPLLLEWCNRAAVPWCVAVAAPNAEPKFERDCTVFSVIIDLVFFLSDNGTRLELVSITSSPNRLQCTLWCAQTIMQVCEQQFLGQRRLRINAPTLTSAQLQFECSQIACDCKIACRFGGVLNGCCWECSATKGSHGSQTCVVCRAILPGNKQLGM